MIESFVPQVVTVGGVAQIPLIVSSGLSDNPATHIKSTFLSLADT